MITYDKSPFGINLLFRFHGSAIYRGAIPGFLSAVALVLYRVFAEGESRNGIQHPYAVGVLVGSLSFLLIFRVQIAYARYWEAVSAVYHFSAKWMDATVHTAVFHMQCSHYDVIKPPSYFDYPELNRAFLTRDRERNIASRSGVHGSTEDVVSRAVKKSIERVDDDGSDPISRAALRFNQEARERSMRMFDIEQEIKENHLKPSETLLHDLPNVSNEGVLRDPNRLLAPPRLDGNWGRLFNDSKSTFHSPNNPTMQTPEGFAGFHGGRTPPLFLQELAHLSSLLHGVALSTLRNDIEGAQSPLGVFVPGSPWPDVDPTVDKSSAFYDMSLSSLSTSVLYFLGMARSATERTKYNATRPLPVYGGVSDAEIHFLQMSRGPYAKMQLCWMWLSDFMIREHLAGSLGKVGPPIISRLVQFLSDGTVHVCFNNLSCVVSLLHSCCWLILLVL